MGSCIRENIMLGRASRSVSKNISLYFFSQIVRICIMLYLFFHGPGGHGTCYIFFLPVSRGVDALYFFFRTCQPEATQHIFFALLPAAQGLEIDALYFFSRWVAWPKASKLTHYIFFRAGLAAADLSKNP